MTAALHLQISNSFRIKRLTAVALPVLILAYLAYVFVAFDVAGLAGRAKMDNARILLADFVSYKTHVTRDNRAGEVRISIEGEGKGTYPKGRLPEWVTQSGGITTIDLGRGNIVTYDAVGASFVVPGYGTIALQPDGNKIKLTAPLPLADWINATDTRVSVTTPAGRFAYSRSKVETFRYQPGWEMFFFTLDSQFSGKSYGQLTAMLMGPRLDPAQSNVSLMVSQIWHNRIWHHSDVAGALFETVLMAFLGTFGAALISLPLAFLAASNFTPVRWLRFGLRRLFDFVRGVDGLIWTIILSRAFGPGPMTGALAILLTETGTFGKTFSEALENIDDKQVEGIRSTGASALQRARFGVIPQVAPILLSQVLYYFESNTRSATVIGAIVGGGIGLLLTQAIITQKDWEEVAYYMILIVLMVMAMDSLSGWIRRRFIKG